MLSLQGILEAGARLSLSMGLTGRWPLKAIFAISVRIQRPNQPHVRLCRLRSSPLIRGLDAFRRGDLPLHSNQVYTYEQGIARGWGAHVYFDNSLSFSLVNTPRLSGAFPDRFSNPHLLSTLSNYCLSFTISQIARLPPDFSKLSYLRRDLPHVPLILCWLLNICFLSALLFQAFA